MQSFLRANGVMLCGIISSILTAGVLLVVNELTGLSFFTLGVWFVVPVGAILSGAFATSGYFLGAKYFHYRPGLIFLLQMAFVAALTQMAIYVGEYMVGLNVPFEVQGFLRWLGIVLMQSNYRVGLSTFWIDTGEVGGFGFVMALIQFVGFMVGAAAVFVYLKNYPFCDTCQKYLRPAGSKAELFSEYKGVMDRVEALRTAASRDSSLGDIMHVEGAGRLTAC